MKLFNQGQYVQSAALARDLVARAAAWHRLEGAGQNQPSNRDMQVERIQAQDTAAVAHG